MAVDMLVGQEDGSGPDFESIAYLNQKFLNLLFEKEEDLDGEREMRESLRDADLGSILEVGGLRNYRKFLIKSLIQRDFRYKTLGWEDGFMYMDDTFSASAFYFLLYSDYLLYNLRKTPKYEIKHFDHADVRNYNTMLTHAYIDIAVKNERGELKSGIRIYYHSASDMLNAKGFGGVVRLYPSKQMFIFNGTNFIPYLSLNEDSGESEFPVIGYESFEALRGIITTRNISENEYYSESFMGVSRR